MGIQNLWIWLFNDVSKIFIYRLSVIFGWFYTEMTNLMQCFLQYNFFSRNQNCCHISPWASNIEKLECVVSKSHMQSQNSLIQINIFLEFVQIYFGSVKEENMYRSRALKSCSVLRAAPSFLRLLYYIEN